MLFIFFCVTVASCGKNEGKQTLAVSSIANGEKLAKEHPLEKSIVSILTRYKEFRCTGSILTRNSILTAAHCVLYRDHPIIINGKTYEVERNIVYPTYSQYNITDDIAIIKLKTEIDAKDFHPVTLDTSEVIHKKLTLVGRSVYITSPYPDYITALLKIMPKDQKRSLSNDLYNFIQQLPVIKSDLKNSKSESFTLNTYRSRSLNKKNSEVLFYNNLTGGPLPGDSGSPIFVENKDGSFLQRGITQYVKMNYQYKYLMEYHVHDSTAYANIPYYLEWLEEMAAKNNLGKIKTARAEERKLSACDDIKMNINEQFIEKLGMQFLDSVLREKCEKDNLLTKNIQDNIKQCQKICGSKDQTCEFAVKSLKIYESTLEVLCSK